MKAELFYFFSGIAILFSLLVIFLKSPVTSTLSLVVSFFSVSALFVLLHAPFLGVIQVLIYAGAILVLFLYVTMLLSVEPPAHPEPKWKKWLSLAAIPLIVSGLCWIVDFPKSILPEIPESFGSTSSLGEQLLGPWALLFELISVVLLAAIVGAVLLSTRREGKTS